MTTKTIDNLRKVGGNYFSLFHTRTRPGATTLDFYLEQFNADDYWIFKYTGKFREVTYEDLLEFKFAGYIFFNKQIYNKEHIDKWIKFSNELYIPFLVKPSPPFNITSKIIIKK
jgi:hypothetical protein